MAKNADDGVNLDALIEREDFESEQSSQVPAGKLGREIYLSTLTSEDRLPTLRKPDFQRETSGWTPEIVAAFVQSVADGDVIPSVIMWRSPTTGKTFIIDGAHRLSALVAWINDDYGDGAISRDFYGESITDRQITLARTTKALVEGRVGRWDELFRYGKSGVLAPSPLKLLRSNNIQSLPINVQPIEGDAAKAEASYKRINSTAVPISPTELALIDSRRFPTSIATRTLLRAGRGYDYGGKFAEPLRSQLKETAKLIYDQLVIPITDYPLVALDLPSPRRGYSANSLNTIYDLVKYMNAPLGKQTPDANGDVTLSQLERVRSSTERVFGRQHPGSLALHPALYCYDGNGKFVGKAFIGAIEFVKDLIFRDKVFEFTERRGRFESFLTNHRHLITQIGKTQGSGGRRGVPAVLMLYKKLFEALKDGKSDDETIEFLKAVPTLKFLDWDEPPEEDSGKQHSPEQVAAALMRNALEKDICPECLGRLYIKDRSKDHPKPLSDGGQSVSTNLAFTHPYCNTGFKEKKRHDAKAG